PRRRVSLCLAVALASAACSAPVASGLTEPEANRVVLALSDAKIGATKKVDAQSEGRFLVEVPTSEVASALQTLQQRGLPSPRSTGILASLGETGLAASRTSEHARPPVGPAGPLPPPPPRIGPDPRGRAPPALPEPGPFRS